MKLLYNIHIQKVGDQYLGITTGDDAAAIPGILRFNETGATIVRLLRNDISRDDLLTTLQQEYDAPLPLLSQCLDDLLSYLQQSHLLTISE